ncbi:aspartate aminotransferase family protein [Candidatus Sumerlaeota bacterium]|nr:aspartate aminotransferase family protein [Candidatus Sumerlaeota bacterium]
MDTTSLKNDAKKYLMNTYGERDICIIRGSGARVWDSDGREYLDFLSGISVNNLGHCPPFVVQAAKDQCESLIHCSNLYLIKPQIELAKKLVEFSFADKCFFANSGTEAIEGAIKLARLYSRSKYGANRFEIISMKQSFHGRTMGSASATGQKKIQDGFEPMLEGFVFAEFNDIDSVKRLVNEKTCAVIVEPVQGEGGVIPATPEFLRDLRALCDEKDLVLIFDEIQCGLGRTGTNFACEYYKVVPDVMTLAKSLGGGFPIGALLARAPFSEVFSPGKHAHTFGGNPVACAAALAFTTELFDKNVSKNAAEMGKHLMSGLKNLSRKFGFIKEIRGVGLMIGVVLDRPCKEINKRCMENGLLANCTCENVVRILPPLIINRDDCDKALQVLEKVFSLES